MSDTPAGPDWWLASDGKWYPPSSRAAVAPQTPVFGPGPYDTPPAADWWLASDGKWYPPSSHPSVRGLPTPPLTPSDLAIGRALAGWLQALFWFAMVVGGILAVTSGLAHAAHDAYRGGDGRVSAWIEADDRVAISHTLMLLVMIAVFILLLVWTRRAHMATDALYPGRRSWSRGWAIGAWFVPLGNWLLPKLVLDEIERIAVAPRSNGVVGPQWRDQRVSALGWVWWGAWVIGSLLWFVGTSSGGDQTDPLLRTAEQTSDFYAASGAAGVAFAVAAGCAALYVRRLSSRLSVEAMSTGTDAGY